MKSIEDLYKGEKGKSGFAAACNKSEILVRTAYQRAMEHLLDTGVEESAKERFGLQQFLHEYSRMLDEINKKH